ncbi:MAG: hypothetical protein H0W83_02210, partial [Planctomycetes bacterium]|nr:hypothetical protein [Planctomycetota bacterium]
RLAWNWKPKPDDPVPAVGQRHPAWVGNHYCTRFPDAWSAAVEAAAKMPALEARSRAFVDAFISSTLPAAVTEAALYNLSTLRSQTCFRTADGRFYGWEGTWNDIGSCHGSCTHVWNYEQSTPFLFGDLARSQREIEFAQATRDDGQMSFRVELPIARAQAWGKSAADGQLGCLMKLYRDWQLSGDDAFLRSLWPKARKALEFCWIRGGWDADRDGVMEGCQHNTMDVEYYGPNGQMQFWYLGALRACEEMARHLGESDFAATCHGLFDRGSRWADAHLFNGEYYEQQIRPMDPAAIAPELKIEMGGNDPREPVLQLGAACLVDQLVGQYQAHICGLGYLADPTKIAKTLASVHRYNFQRGMRTHFNHLRTFALADESALLMATYPRGRRPKRPFPYFNEVMTGFEYTAAVGMIYEGQRKQGLECIAAIRARYDGKRRSPFNEAECGHHYARAMAAWAANLALTGFRYSGVERAITFAAAPGKGHAFWSNGHAWGVCRQRTTAGRSPGSITVEIEVVHGELALTRIDLTGRGRADFALVVVTPAKPLRQVVNRGRAMVPAVRKALAARKPSAMAHAGR